MRPNSRSLALAVLAIVIAGVALVARWNHVNASPFDFAEARQLQDATLARGYYVLHLSAAPDWQRRVMRARLRDAQPIELPILPFATAIIFRLVGGEHLWIPRLLSALFWILGALFLYLLARRFTHGWAALLGVAIYLFLPFPLVASTSFQPDPLMVMLILASILATVRHHERPTQQRLGVAIGVCAAAVFVKPGIAAFFTLPAFAALAIARCGTRRAFASPSFYLFPVLSLLPAVVLYVYGAIGGSFLQGKIQESVNPHLLLESIFWHGWLDMIRAVLRAPFFGDRSALLVLIVAASGVLLARTRAQRAVLLALWGGYFLFGLTIDNYVSTHDYYSLPLVPIAALSLAVVAGAVGDLLRGPLSRRSVQVGTAVLAAVVVGGVLQARGANLGLPPVNYVADRRIPEYEYIGRLLDHSSRVLLLGSAGVWQYGWIAGRYWPGQSDLSWERVQDRLPPMNADERFRTTDGRYYPAVGAMHPRPRFFAATEPMELVLQPDLCVLLSDFRVVAAGRDYMIFDLTRKAASNGIALRDEVVDADFTSSKASYYAFPPQWRRIERGLRPRDVLKVLGRPQHIVTRHDLRKPVETWFYGPGDSYALVFVDGRVFDLASTRIAGT
jgi:4-amino-4-deoxy-L-arabinose transferase-like glycosyltransferase